MRYMLLIYGDETANAGMTPAEQEAVTAAWFQYTTELEHAGKLLGGDGLQPTGTATTVRADNAKTLLSDGPFAETKEQLGGFYLIDVADLDQAVAWASKMPNLPRGGSVEVRPVMEFDTP